jgi:hypothetical protein
MKTANKMRKSVAVILFLLYGAPGIAQSILPKIYLYPELFTPSVSTTIRVDPRIEQYLGTTFSLEKDLAMSSSPKIFRFNAIAGSGMQFAFNYMNINRSGTAYLARDIAFDDTVYHAGANASAYFNSQIFGADWRFSFFNNPVFSAGVLLGFRWMELGTGIKLESGEFQYARDEKIGVPAPLLGVHGSAYITSHFLARATLEYFHLNIQGYEALAADHRFSLEYYPLKNLGIGSAYYITRYKVTKFPFEKDFSGEVDYSLKGLSFFVGLRF